jgi:putative membrane protein
MYMDWQGWGMGGGGWLFMLLFWGAVIALIVFLVRRTGEGRRGESAMDVLKRRYAKGEITKEEYESMKKDIEKP